MTDITKMGRYGNTKMVISGPSLPRYIPNEWLWWANLGPLKVVGGWAVELILLIGWLALAVVVGHVAGEKGRSRIGFFLLALFLSPLIGFLAVIAIPKVEAGSANSAPRRGSDLIICHQCRKPRRADSVHCPNCGAGKPDPYAGQKKCPACAEWILAEAKKCKHCGELQPEVTPAPAMLGASANWKKLDETERMLNQRRQ